MPKPRFRLHSLLALLVVIATGMSLWIRFAPAVPITGEQDVGLEVEVRDADSGNPIASALIEVADPFSHSDWSKASQSMTRSDGRARLVHRLTFTGERRAYRFQGQVQYANRWLEVSAPGYERLVAPLAQFTGEQGELRRSAPIRVALRAGTSPGDVLQDIAGPYGSLSGMRSTTLDIRADGRFTWVASACFSYEQAYGFVQRVEGRLILKPILHNQQGVSGEDFSPRYPIRWGECAFLLSENQILDFCNAINHGPDPGKQVTCHFSRRKSDQAKKLEGLPALPGYWNTYLLKKPVTATIRQVGDDGSATIDRGSEDGIKTGMHLKAHGRKGEKYPFREAEVVAVEVDSSVIRRVSLDCVWRQQLSYFGDGAFGLGEKVTSRFLDEDEEDDDE